MPLRRQIQFLLLAFALGIPTLAAAEKPPSDADVRKSIERSLPFLEKAGVAWMNDKKCISCHAVSFMLWSHNVAHSRGIGIDEAKLAKWTEWTADESLSQRNDNPVISGGVNDGGGFDTMAQLLLGRGSVNDIAT